MRTLTAILTLILATASGVMAQEAIQLVDGGKTNAGDFTVGWRFSTTAPLKITALGMVDIGQDGLLSAHTVTLATADGALVHGSATVPAGTEARLQGETRFVTIPSILLPAGDHVIYTDSGKDPFYHTSRIRTADALSFTEGRFAKGSHFPDQVFAGNAYFGPVFMADGLQMPQDGAAAPRYAVDLLAKISGEAVKSPAKFQVIQRDFKTGTASVSVAIDCPPDASSQLLFCIRGPENAETRLPVTESGVHSTVSLAAGWYELECGLLEHGQIVQRKLLTAFGVGEVFIVAGQSNSANHGQPGYQLKSQMVTTWAGGTAWRTADDPQPMATGKGGSFVPRLGDKLAAELGVPIGFLAVGVGGTSTRQWVGGLSKRISAAAAVIKDCGGCRAILWHQGESDAIANVTRQEHAKNLAELIACSRADLGCNVPWFIAIAAFHPKTTEQQEREINEGQKLAIANDPAVFAGPNTDQYPKTPETLFDSVHFNHTGLDRHAEDWKTCLLPFLQK